MKYFKTFEKFDKLEELPKIGDYAIFNLHNFNKIMNDFAFNNIGKVVELSKGLYNDEFYITVVYGKNINIPYEIKHKFIYDTILKSYIKTYSSNSLEYFSNNKNDVEVYIASKKYNL